MPPKQQTEDNEEGVVPSWRRSGSFRNKMQSTETTNSTSKFIEYILITFLLTFKLSFSLIISCVCHFLELEDKDNNIKITPVPNKISGEPDVVLRRTHSFETDEK